MATRGFTLIELLIAIAVAGVLILIGAQAFDGLQTRFQVREGRNIFAAMHSTTRALAIESGQNVMLHFHGPGDSIWITRNDTTLDKIALEDETGVDLYASGSPHTLCMNSRGYAQASCTSFDVPVRVIFTAGRDTARVRVLPLGQLIY